MNTHSTFSFRLSWTPQDLADAVPLRLFEKVAFDAGFRGDDIAPCSNRWPAPRRWRGAYRPRGELPARLLVC